MPSLQPLVHHVPDVLPRHVRDGLSQVLLVRPGIADELSFALALSLGLGLDEQRQGEGVGLDFDQARGGHGDGIECCVPIVAQKQNPATWGRAGLRFYVP